MSFAVVQFLAETDSNEIVVQEVSSTLITKEEGTICKWPPEDKQVKIYISKQYLPLFDWEEHPVIVKGYYGK